MLAGGRGALPWYMADASSEKEREARNRAGMCEKRAGEASVLAEGRGALPWYMADASSEKERGARNRAGMCENFGLKK